MLCYAMLGCHHQSVNIVTRISVQNDKTAFLSEHIYSMISCTLSLSLPTLLLSVAMSKTIYSFIVCLWEGYSYTIVMVHLGMKNITTVSKLENFLSIPPG